ncbi:MAG TPA: hypothetical protein VEY95_08065 [Azospirillaceae bacterium]|nr:hypothetical protein [Azospirillaceae bacterium]
MTTRTIATVPGRIDGLSRPFLFQAIFQALAGIDCLLFADRAAGLLVPALAGDPAVALGFQMLGGFLLLEAAFLMLLGRPGGRRTALRPLFVWLNWAWVAGSVALALVAGPVLSAAGIVLVLAQAGAVAGFALAQRRAIRR